MSLAIRRLWKWLTRPIGPEPDLRGVTQPDGSVAFPNGVRVTPLPQHAPPAALLADPAPYLTHEGQHGWLVRFLVGPMFLARRLENLGQSLIGAIEDRHRDPHALVIFVQGEAPPYALEMIDRAVAGSLDLDERCVAVRLEQIDEKQLHLGLKQIDRVLDDGIVDVGKMVQRSVHVDSRIVARANRAAARSIAADRAAVSGWKGGRINPPKVA